MMLNIEAFHRRAVILPSNRHYFVICIPDPTSAIPRCYIDTCAPFGARSSESNAGSVANAIVDVMKAPHAGIDANKWVDDLALFRFPLPLIGLDTLYSCDRASLLDSIALTGTPWHPVGDKGSEFGPILDHLGFLWSVQSKQVGLTNKKPNKYLTRFRAFHDASIYSDVSLRDCQSILGTMVHLCFLLPLGSSRMASLCRTTSRFFSNKYARYHVQDSVRADIRWWISQLEDPFNPPSRILKPRGTTTDLSIFVDASTSWGIGVLINDCWAAWRLLPNWKDSGAHIGCLECWAVELIVLVLMPSIARTSPSSFTPITKV